MTTPEQLLEDLTEPQREAVTHRDGPLLVLAGAGSGKTRVITRRAAYLALTACDPFRILAITFTNKAANEMRQRIEAINVAPGITVCTFHSLCARLLRIHAGEAGLSGNFSIFDQADRRAAVKDAIHRCGLAETNWRPSGVEARISLAKNDNYTPETYAARHGGDYESKVFTRIFMAYEDILREQNALDFDDLLLRTAAMLRASEPLCQHLEDRYHYLLIDEYQDTNLVQYEIARHLTHRCQNLCATGDPDQSIYGWRGANIDNILKFEDDFPDARVVRLEQNYRSTKAILRAAGSLIAVNRLRKKKDLWTENDEGSPVRIVECPDAEAEARYIAEQIDSHREQGRSLSDIAILYRVNSLSRVLEDALRRAVIPYQIARGVEFYNRKEIKDVLAYLRILINPADDTALLRIINTPARGIGKTTIDRLRSVAADAQVPLWDIVADPARLTVLGAGPQAKIRAFAKLVDSLRPSTGQPVENTVLTVITLSGLLEALEEENGRENSALANVKELVSAAADYDTQNPEGDLVDWLQQVSLVSDVDSVDPTIGAVTLMTLHAAKGLEFPVVYIIAFEEGFMPMQRRDTTVSPREREEERRLCFVGMTRAMQELVFTQARVRTIMGAPMRTSPSPFQASLPRSEIDWVGIDQQGLVETPPARKPKARTGIKANLDDLLQQWPKGSLVAHPSFGRGTVRWVIPSPGQSRISVDFERSGTKTLILEHAHLKRIDDTIPE